MTQALIAVVSLLIGAGLNEIVRRWNRIEVYAPAVFQKRLAIHEQLWSKMQTANDVAGELMVKDNLTKEQRHELTSGIILDVAEFCDENSLYLNEDLTVHCCTVFMGVEDVADLKGKRREQAMQRVREKFAQALDIIKQESGIGRIDKLFRSIARPSYSSDVIEYYRGVKAKQNRRK